MQFFIQSVPYDGMEIYKTHAVLSFPNFHTEEVYYSMLCEHWPFYQKRLDQAACVELQQCLEPFAHSVDQMWHVVEFILV